MKGPKLKIDLNIADVQRDNVHGTFLKDLIVLHETVSRNYSGLGDIRSVSEYLDNKDYGIHGITDGEGHIAWALGLGRALFYHTASGFNGGINTRGIGIEQVSRVMLDHRSRAARFKAWMQMDKELNATAKLVACIARAHKIPLESSIGRSPGVTTHWEITQTFGVRGGHVDCWPYHLGGYYPKMRVIYLARRYYRLGWHF